MADHRRTAPPVEVPACDDAAVSGADTAATDAPCHNLRHPDPHDDHETFLTRPATPQQDKQNRPLQYHRTSADQPDVLDAVPDAPLPQQTRGAASNTHDVTLAHVLQLITTQLSMNVSCIDVPNDAGATRVWLQPPTTPPAAALSRTQQRREQRQRVLQRLLDDRPTHSADAATARAEAIVAAPPPGLTNVPAALASTSGSSNTVVSAHASAPAALAPSSDNSSTINTNVALADASAALAPPGGSSSKANTTDASPRRAAATPPSAPPSPPL
jgi:hypothetical protein